MPESKGLLYIPDISGFTRFVTQTEQKHSRHIIRELIEVILDSNRIKLLVSEIEGDAVLFYKPGPAPSLEELIGQTKEIFVNFHSYLKVIERDRVCQCGACSTASELSLKFITHYGELEEVSIQNFNKIMGSDVILAHRLLKNNIDESEYLLYTFNYTDELTEKLQFEDWVEEKSYSEEIENFGNIQSTYISLSALKNQLPEVPPIRPSQIAEGDPDIMLNIDAPLSFVHDALTNHKHKWEYIDGIKEIRNAENINRLNSAHTCVFDDLEVHFVTTGHSADGGQMSYSERAEVSIGITFTNYYRLKSRDSGTELSLYLIQDDPAEKKSTIISRLFYPLKKKIIRIKILQTARASQKNFKAYCERKYKEQVSGN